MKGLAGRHKVGLPPRPFLYTLDQIAAILSIREDTVRTRYIWYDGRSVGVRRKQEMLARNIADPDEKPDWRVSEQEFIRWMQFKGFKFYTRAGLYSDPVAEPEALEARKFAMPDIPEEGVDPTSEEE